MHGNAVLRQIQRQGLGQPHAAELGRAVAGVMLAAHLAGFGVDLNDAPGNAVADHQARELSGAEEIAHQVHLQRAVKIPQFNVANKRCFGDPGAVDQQIDPVKNLIHPVRQRHHALLAGGVGAKAIRLAFTKLLIDLAGDPGGFFALNVHHRHAIPFCGQPAAEIFP